MRVHSSTRYAAFAAMVGALACAGNRVKPDEAGAARDTTTVSDTTQNPSGYRGTVRDTSITPTRQTPRDTLLQNQGTGHAQDTSGYSGAGRPDTTSQPGQANPQAQDTSGYRSQTDTSSYGRDTTGTAGMPADTSAMDSSRMNPSSSGVTGLDSTGTSKSGDTTGYNPSQQSRDTTSR